jgi:hypothetical protein
MVLALVLACDGGLSGPGRDGDPGGGDAAPASAGRVNCDTKVCEGAGMNVCCLKLVLIPPMVETRCVAQIGECGGDSRFECDEAADCSAERCCLLNASGGSGNTLVATCEAACNFFQDELCQGHGTGSCTDGRFCCQEPDSAYGVCKASAADCAMP